MASVTIVIVLALSAAGGGTAYASQRSLPGDTLYSVKLSTEKVRMMLPGNDTAKVERAVGLADRRVAEIVSLAEEGRTEHLELAAERYDDALDDLRMRLERMANGRSVVGSLMTLVAQAMSGHVEALDVVCDMVPAEDRAAITRARDSSLARQQYALMGLVHDNPAGAVRITLAAMDGRLLRAVTMAGQADGSGVEEVLEQFEAMGVFGDELFLIVHEAGISTAELEEKVLEAASVHLSVLDEVNYIAPDEAGPAVARARQACLNRFGNWLISLAWEDPMRAAEINLAAQGDRLNRIADADDAEGAEDGLRQYDDMAQFGEEVYLTAREWSADQDRVGKMIAEATVMHLELLAELALRVPEQARTAVQRVMARELIRQESRVEVLEQRGVESPRSPAVPPIVWEGVQEQVRVQRIWGVREGKLVSGFSPGVPGGRACPC